MHPSFPLLLLLLLFCCCCNAGKHMMRVPACPTESEAAAHPASPAATTELECAMACHLQSDCFAANLLLAGGSCLLATGARFFSDRWRTRRDSENPSDCESFVLADEHVRQTLINELFLVFFDFRRGFNNLVTVGDFSGVVAEPEGVSVNDEGVVLNNDTINSFVQISGASQLYRRMTPIVSGHGEFGNFSLYVKFKRHLQPDKISNLMFACKCENRYKREAILSELIKADLQMQVRNIYIEEGLRFQPTVSPFDEPSTRIESDWTTYIVSYNASRTADDTASWVQFYSGFNKLLSWSIPSFDPGYMTQNSSSCLRFGYAHSDTKSKLTGTLQCVGIGPAGLAQHDTRPLVPFC